LLRMMMIEWIGRVRRTRKLQGDSRVQVEHMWARRMSLEVPIDCVEVREVVLVLMQGEAVRVVIVSVVRAFRMKALLLLHLRRWV
jgi:hypothetical protein